MRGYKDAVVGISDRFCRGTHQGVTLFRFSFAAQTACRFVADLYHADLHAALLNSIDAVNRELIDSSGLISEGHILPLLGSLLFAGIGPKVGVMEIDQKTHAVFRGAFSELDRRIYGTVSAAVAVAVLVKGIVPHADADVVYARLMQCFHQVLRSAVKSVEHSAARFKRHKTGNVRAHDEVL